MTLHDVTIFLSLPKCFVCVFTTPQQLRYIIVVSYSISSAAHGGGIKDSKAEWPYPVLRCTALAAFVFPTFSIYHSLFHLFILRKRFKGKNQLSFMKDFSRHCLVGGTGFVGFRKRLSFVFCIFLIFRYLYFVICIL